MVATNLMIFLRIKLPNCSFWR